MNFNTLKVKEIIELTPEAKEFVFELPENLHTTYHHLAGQFVSLKLYINGEEVRRDYSICTKPNSEGLLGIGVKRIENGLVSNYLNNELKVGQEIEVSEPQGRFTYEKKGKQLVLIAAGSGITPILSILKDNLQDPDTENIQLLYGSRSAEQTMFLKEILSLSEAYSSKFQLTLFQSQEYQELGGGNNVTYREGRIKESFIQDQIEAGVFSQYANYFICGPEDLIKRVQLFLKRNFVADQNIHVELFTALTNKKSDEPEVKSTDGKVSVKAYIDGGETSVEIDKNQYILDGLIETELDPPYSCQGGVCGACMCTLKEGEVDMEDNFTLTDEEMDEGKILTCISRPKSDSIELIYD